ncbi:MAG: serine esterase [Bdellovibrionaceae bacterium]|nr:serine esterase [Pseudobdellovibrionaceae bacterium]MDW8190128.1 serine esterase [Pseudobdellovibrionaceae bacterium]
MTVQSPPLTVNFVDYHAPESTPPSASHLMVMLFHGYGADAFDLVLLKDVIRFPENYHVHWVFPQGPLSVPLGPGWMGRAWWPIDFNTLEQALQNKDSSILSQKKPEGLDVLQQSIFHLVAHTFKIPWSQVVLGGFSQGAMLATHLFLHCPEPPRGLISFSGALINARQWEAAPSSCANRHVFLSHGRHDPILGFDNLNQLERLLIRKGCQVKTCPFVGGHEIPPIVIQELNTWIPTWFHHSTKS